MRPNGAQQFICKTCKRVYSSLYGTPFAGVRISKERQDAIVRLVEANPYVTAADVARVGETNWMSGKRILESLKAGRSIPMAEINARSDKDCRRGRRRKVIAPAPVSLGKMTQPD